MEVENKGKIVVNAATKTLLAVILLHITTVLYLDVASYYYNYYHYEMSITIMTTHIFDSDGTTTLLLCIISSITLHYVLSVLLLTITMIQLPIIELSS